MNKDLAPLNKKITVRNNFTSEQYNLFSSIRSLRNYNYQNFYGEISSKDIFLFTIRFKPEVNNDFEIVYKSDKYKIIKISNIDADFRFLEIIAEKNN